MAEALEHDERRTRALKERIYASFTGLSILGALVVGGHTTAAEALLSLAVGVLGISAAGFIAEVVAYQVGHRALPDRAELATMAMIALGALGSASAPILVLALAWGGVLSLNAALYVGMGVYTFTLVVIMLLASHRAGLRAMQQLVASALLVGLALVVVGILLIAHLH